MLCIDFWRISSRFQGDTLELVHKPIRDSRPMRWCGRFGIAPITIGFLLQLLAASAQTTDNVATGTLQPKAQQPEIVGSGKNRDTSIDPATVTYTSHKWDLPIVQSVLIPTKFASEAGLIAVARRIDRDALDYQTVDVEIFDNEKAERLSRVEIWRRELTKAEDAFCKLHTLAVYRRNRGVNINELSLYDNESTGKVIKGSVRKIIRLTEGEPLGAY